MSIAILATGNELISGDTLNTNGQKIAHSLHSEGLSVGQHLSCTDALENIVSGITFLANTHDTIIITGGLGPTSDDRTRFALAQFLNLPLIEYPKALSHITTRLKRANLSLNAGNHQQCLFPKGAELLDNPNGTAMGCFIQLENKKFILLPGPPNECLPMFHHHVLAKLNHKNNTELLLKWRLFAVAESQIAEKLEYALMGEDCTLGYRLDSPYLEFKLHCKKEEATKLKTLIEPIVTPHILCGLNKASDQLRTLLDTIQQPIMIIDEASGGHLQTLIQRPNNYATVHFHKVNDAKLHFRLSGLNAYWQQLSDTYETTVSIDYQSTDKIGQENHKLPYRSTALVLPLAAEWLSFRLFHLITQLHEVIT